MCHGDGRYPERQVDCSQLEGMRKSGFRSVDLRRNYCISNLSGMHSDLYIESIQSHLDLYSDYMLNTYGKHVGSIRNQCDSHLVYIQFPSAMH